MLARGGASGSDSLPWLFYKDGVRELTHRCKGFEDDGARQAPRASSSARARRRRRGRPRHDAVGGGFRVPAVPLRRSAARRRRRRRSPTAARRTAASREEIRARRSEAVEESRVAAASSTWPTSTRRSTSSTSARSSICRRSRSASTQQDLRTNVVAMLLDIFEQQTDAGDARRGASSMLDTLMVYLLSAAQFRSVAYLLRESQVAVRRARASCSRSSASSCSQLPARLSAPEALAQLLQSLDDARDAAAARGARSSCSTSCAAPRSATVFEWLGKLQNARLRAAARAGRGATGRSEHRASWCSSSGSTDRGRRARGDPARRRAEDASGRGCRSGKVLQRRRRRAAPRSPCRRWRRSARRARCRRSSARSTTPTATCASPPCARSRRARYRPALAKLEAVVKGKAMRDADLTEKMAFFEAYGALCGDAGVPQLDGCSTARDFSDGARIRRSARAPRWRSGACRQPNARSRRCESASARRTSSCATR